MTEEEKIFAGKLFDARTKELRDIKKETELTSSSLTIAEGVGEKNKKELEEVKESFEAYKRKTRVATVKLQQKVAEAKEKTEKKAKE